MEEKIEMEKGKEKSKGCEMRRRGSEPQEAGSEVWGGRLGHCGAGRNRKAAEAHTSASALC